MDTVIKTVNLDSKLDSHDLSLEGKRKYKKISRSKCKRDDEASCS